MDASKHQCINACMREVDGGSSHTVDAPHILESASRRAGLIVIIVVVVVVVLLFSLTKLYVC